MKPPSEKLGPPTAASHAPGGPLPNHVRPTRYALAVDVDPSSQDFAGRVSIDLELQARTAGWVMHAEELEVSAAHLEQAGASIPCSVKWRPAPARGLAPDEIEIVLRQPAAAGTARLEVEYVGQLRSTFSRGLSRYTRDGRRYVFSHLEPASARRVFPAFDEPRFKTPFQLTVSTPEGNRAWSNTPLQTSSPTRAGDWRAFEFAESPPLPTYLVALAVGPFEEEPVDLGAMPATLLGSFAESADSTIAAVTLQRQVQAATAWLGRPYPFQKLDLLGVPRLPFGVAMEHPGLVTVEERFLFATERSPAWTRSLHERVIAHELAHMWFGNLVTLAWWDDLWLNEGLASWMEYEVCARASSECSGEAEASVHKAHVMRLDFGRRARRVRRVVPTARHASACFDDFTYLKGMSIVRMAKHWLGEETLLRGLRAYLDEHRWGVVTTDDLMHALSRASGENVAPALESFLDQTGAPLVNVQLSCPESGDGAPSLQLSQRPYVPLGQVPAKHQLWTIPVCVRFDSGKGPEQHCILLSQANATATLPTTHCPDWLVPNAYDGGYYYYSYSASTPSTPQRAMALAKQPDRLSEAEQIGLLANSWALVESGDLPADAYLELVLGFRNSRSPGVWSQIVTAWYRLEDMLPTSARSLLEAHVRRLVGPVAHSVGFSWSVDEPRGVRVLRGTLQSALGGLGRDPWARRQAAALAGRWLRDPESLHIDAAMTAVPLHAAGGDARLLEQLLRLVSSQPASETLDVAILALARFEDPELVHRVLDASLEAEFPPGRRRALYRGMFERPITRDATYAWVTQHLEQVQTKVSESTLNQIYHILPELCREDQWRPAVELFEPHARGLTQRWEVLHEARRAAERCAAVATRQAPLAERWLRQNGSATHH